MITDTETPTEVVTVKGRAQWLHRRMPVWLVLPLVLAGLIGTVTGFALRSSDLSEARADLKGALRGNGTLAFTIVGQKKSLEKAEDKTQAAEKRADNAVKRAEDAEAAAKAAVEAEYAPKLKAIEDREAAVTAREQAVTLTEVARDQNTFGDGVWEVGVDIQPGRYKTAGGSDCYWQKTDAGGDIIDNDLPGGPATVNIESSVFSFKSAHCGEWTKVG